MYFGNSAKLSTRNSCHLTCDTRRLTCNYTPHHGKKKWISCNLCMPNLLRESPVVRSTEQPHFAVVLRNGVNAPVARVLSRARGTFAGACISFAFIIHILRIYYAFITYLLCIFCPFVCPSVYPSICPSVCPSAYPCRRRGRNRRGRRRGRGGCISYVFILHLLYIYYVFIMHLLSIYYVRPSVMFFLRIYYAFIIYTLCIYYVFSVRLSVRPSVCPSKHRDIIIFVND